MDINNQNQNKNGSLSRRMFLKVVGWLTMTAGMVKIPGFIHSQEKSDVISENVRFEGKGVTVGLLKNPSLALSERHSHEGRDL